jgi:hypothetical protein
VPLQGIGTIPVPPTLGVSPSMNPAIGNVQANLSTIITTVQTAQPDAQFAVADYKDMGDSQPFTVDSNLTASAATAIAAANSITASGGGDIPEDQINALYQVGSGAIGFRPDSTRLVVWFGDAMGHDPSNGKTINDAITALNGVSAKVLAINVDTGFASTALDASGQATQIATATGGAYLGTVGATEVSSKILDGLTNLDATVTAVPTCDPGLSVSLSPASQTVPSGTSATFDEAITVAAGATQGATLHCSTNFLVNGLDAGPAFVQSVAITVNGRHRADRLLRPRCQPGRHHPAGLPERRVLSTRGRRQPAGRHGHRVGHHVQCELRTLCAGHDDQADPGPGRGTVRRPG